MTLKPCALLIALLCAAPVQAFGASICDKFTSRVVIAEIEGIRCAFAYARCRDGEMGPDGRFTGKLNSGEVGRGKVACRAQFAGNARACNDDDSEESRFCWSRRFDVFKTGGLE